MSGTSTCESLTCNAKIPEIARKSGCGGIGIRARLRCVWHYVLASSSLAIRIEYVKQLLTVLAVGSCFIFDGWVGRNRVFARYFVTVGRFGKKPGFFDCARVPRVRIHQISLSAIELLSDPHDTKYCLTVDRQLCLN